MIRKRPLLLLLCMLLCLGSCNAFAQTSYAQWCKQAGFSDSNIIAWVEIPGVSLREPVMRHPADDAFYARHSANGAANTYGSLYVQASYNSADFSDPVTLIYGSSADAAAPLHKLQEWYSGSFESLRSVYLHTPEAVREYEVFAALPYSSIHILHYYDFSNAMRYQNFFDSVFSARALGMHLDPSKRPEAGKDHVLIFSTGLRGDSLQRYLVMAKLVTK